MARAGGRRVAVAAALVLVVGAVAGSGLAAVAPAPDSTAAPPDGLTAATGRFAADAVGASAPDPGATVSVTDAGGRASAVGATDALPNAPSNITATQELRLTPAERGEITVVQRYRVPDRVASLKPQLPADVAVTGTTGFDAAGARTYEWDGNTSTPSITFTVRVNETTDLAGPEGARGRYLFVDAGEWALVRRPSIPTSWSWRGAEPVGVDRRAATAGPGYVGEWMAYLGEVSTRERTAHGQRFELVVPERATLAESPGSILDSLATASDRLRVGDRDEAVHAFAAPTTSVGWGVRGLQYGDTDMWVRDAEALSDPENSWLHEYVHTRQSYDTAPSARWTTEAFATYYAALFALEQGRVDYDAFRSVIRRGTVPPQSRAVLTEPGTWAGVANYLKGSLVAADTDRRIRLATDGTRSLQTVFSAMNAHAGRVDGRSYFEAVGAAGGGEVQRAAVTYASTERAPDTWSASAHAEAFASTPALVEVSLAADGLAVSGPYRNGSVRGPELTLFTGETLTLIGTVVNAGGATGEYDARFAVDGRVVANESGSVDPGERVTHRFERSFAESGQHTLAVGGEAVTVEVYQPADAPVTALSANRTDLDGPGAVAFAATVSNGQGVPARGNVTLRGPDGPIIDRRVALGPGENRTVTGVAHLDRGEYEFTVGDADALVVTVGDVGTEGGGRGGDGGDRSGNGGDRREGSGDGTTGFGPGFGPVAALAGLFAGLILLAPRRR